MATEIKDPTISAHFENLIDASTSFARHAQTTLNGLCSEREKNQLLTKDLAAAGAVKASLVKERDTLVGQLHDERNRLGQLRMRIADIIEKVAVTTGKSHLLTIETAVDFLLEERSALIDTDARVKVALDGYPLDAIAKTPAPTLAALMLVAEERVRQNEKYGRTAGTWTEPVGKKLAVLMEEVGEVATELQDDAPDEDSHEARDERLRAELTQVAAVAVAWIERIDVGSRCET